MSHHKYIVAGFRFQVITIYDRRIVTTRSPLTNYQGGVTLFGYISTGIVVSFLLHGVGIRGSKSETAKGSCVKENQVNMDASICLLTLVHAQICWSRCWRWTSNPTS